MTPKKSSILLGLHAEKFKTFKEHSIECMKIINTVSKEERLLMTITNPVVFGEYYIKPFTRKWDTDTADFQYTMIESCMLSHNIVVHIPVEHAKSTWMSLVYPLWMLANDYNCTGAIISNTSRQAKGFLSVIKQHLVNNTLLRRDFNYLIPDYRRKWTETEIYLKRDMESQSKDPSILAIGTGGAILGARLDWVIGDDICDPDNSSTELNREKIEVWWDEVVDSRVVEYGQKILLGTLQHKNDLLCTMSDREIYDYVHFKGLDESTNTPLWADKWSLERLLLKRKTIGVAKFNKVIQNDRKSKATKTLDTNWLHYYGNYRDKQLPPDYELDFYLSFDPALADDKESAKRKKLDKCCIALTALSKVTKDIFLLDYYATWLTFPEQLKLIDTWWQKYNTKCRGIGIEATYYQKALAQQAYLLDSLPPIKSVQVGTQSKHVRLQAFAVYSETGRYHIKDTHADFIAEWEEYEPDGVSPNILDACSIAVTMMTQKGLLTNDERELVQNISF